MYNIILPYILILITFLFTKERILINQEFLIILGFLLTFFLLKTLVEQPVVEALNTYANDIRKTFTDILTFVKHKATLERDNNQKISLTFLNYLIYKKFCLVMVPVARYNNLIMRRKNFLISRKVLADQLVDRIEVLRKKYYLWKFEHSCKRTQITMPTKQARLFASMRKRSKHIKSSKRIKELKKVLKQLDEHKKLLKQLHASKVLVEFLRKHP